MVLHSPVQSAQPSSLARARSRDAKCLPAIHSTCHQEQERQNCSKSYEHLLSRRKVAQGKDSGEPYFGGEPAWHTSRCRPAGVFLSWNSAVTRLGAGWVPCLVCSFDTCFFFFPALIAFQVMIKARQPHRWVYAGLCWSLSHTRFVLPRSPGCAQLLC